MDLVVVGAGPAGLTTALAARRKGLEVSVFEQGLPDDPAPGTWLLNPQGLAVLSELGTFTLRPVERARLEEPGGRVLADLPLRAAVVRRSTLLAELRALCVQAGVKFHWGWRLLSREGILLRFDRGVKECAQVVGADGARSVQRKALRLGVRRYVRGLCDHPPPRPYPLEIWYPDGSRAGFDPTPDGRTGFYYTGVRPHLEAVVEEEVKLCGVALTWSRLRLVGDAACAQAPTLSQGCNMALVDGWHYETRRRRTGMQLLSWAASELATRPFPGRSQLVVWLARQKWVQRLLAGSIRAPSQGLRS